MSEDDKRGLGAWIIISVIVGGLVALLFIYGCADKKTTRTIVEQVPGVEQIAGMTTCTSWENPAETQEFRTRLIDGRGYRCAHRICLDKHGDCRYDCPREEACRR